MSKKQFSFTTVSVLQISLAILVVLLILTVTLIILQPNEEDARIALASQTIAITNHSVSDYDTILTIKNTYENPISIDTLFIDNQKCHFFVQDANEFGVNQTKNITCQTVYELEKDFVAYDVIINWTDLATNESYSQSDKKAQLVGDVKNSYLNIVQSNQYWDDSISGCYTNQTSPIPICTCLDLNKSRNDLHYANFSLQNSLDFVRCEKEFGTDFLSGTGWPSLGNSTSHFQQTFEGNSNIIRHLTMTKFNQKVGFFNSSPNSQIQNVGFVDVDMAGSSSGYSSGVISAFGARSVLSNVYVTGFIDVTNAINFGGFIGTGYYTTIIDSYFEGTIRSTNTQKVGGLIGTAPESNVINSYVDANFDLVNVEFIGGLLGFSHGTGLNLNYSFWKDSSNTVIYCVADNQDYGADCQ